MVLESFADSPVPSAAVLFGLVVTVAERCDGFGHGSRHRTGPNGVIESRITVGVDKRADLLESVGCFGLSSLKFSELRGLTALRALLHGDVLFDRCEALPVVSDCRFQAMDNHSVAATVEHATFQVTVELFLVPGDSVSMVLGGLLKLLDAKGEAVESTGGVGDPSGEESEFGGEGGLFVEKPTWQVGFEQPDVVGGLHGGGLACRGRRGPEH